MKEKLRSPGLIRAPIGLVIATQINARALDRVYKHMKARNGGVGQPEFRLRTSLRRLTLAKR